MTSTFSSRTTVWCAQRCRGLSGGDVPGRPHLHQRRPGQEHHGQDGPHDDPLADSNDSVVSEFTARGLL